MPHQHIQVTVPKTKIDDIIALGERDGVTYAGVSAVKGDVRTLFFLTTAKAQQPFLDDLQSSLHKTSDWHIAILPVTAVVSHKTDEDEPEAPQAREALLEDALRDAEMTPISIALVAISALVAALGMINDNVSAIIGAMVIAPLLGPLLGSVLGVTLGEIGLFAKSARTSVVGIGLAILVGAVLGLAVHFDPSTAELAARTNVGFDDVALALAAGAAAVMTLTSGVASALVGVMVAVALVPPATAMGLFLGTAAWEMAGHSALLLAVNLTALQFSGLIVFLIRGVRPRTRYRRAKVRTTIWLSLGVSGALLVVLVLLIGLQIAR